MAQYFYTKAFSGVKRIFLIIIALISISLIGIIAIQVSWLRNMVVLREDQVNQKLLDITKSVAEELAQYKGNVGSSGLKAFPDDKFSLELQRPYSIGQKFTTQELYERIKRFSAAEPLGVIRY